MRPSTAIPEISTRSTSTVACPAPDRMRVVTRTGRSPARSFDASQPAFFSWLGVTMYLDEAAVVETLRFVAGCAKGSAVLLEYVMPLAGLPPMMRIAMEQMTAQLAERGEPWKSFFEPTALAEKLTALGFSHSRTWTPNELNRRYLADRADGLHIGAGPGRLMLAEIRCRPVLP